MSPLWETTGTLQEHCRTSSSPEFRTGDPVFRDNEQAEMLGSVRSELFALGHVITDNKKFKISFD